MKNDPAKEYNNMSEAYILKSEKQVHYVYYDRPAIKSLTFEVKDKTILEVGCAGGALTEWLVDQRAKVVAIDISEKMIEYTKKRLGSKAKVFVADVSKPLDFVETDSIDVIIASLVLHYISNWLPVFDEFHRVLRNNGSIIISTHHPHADWKWHNRPNYFKKELYEETWTINGKPYTFKYYHRALANMLAIFRRAGFFVDILLEALPVPERRKFLQNLMKI
ncbi:MAG: class I SAM-dependent methyltransferase [Candidatus Heimdallarchaeota archaeon]